MKLISRFILRLLPLGVLVGFVSLMISSGGTIQNDRIEAINRSSGPGRVYAQGGFETLSQMDKTAQVEYVREVFNWSDIETSEGIYDWAGATSLDAVITSEKDADFKVVAVLTGGPAYMAQSANQTVDTTQFLVRWANFVQAAVDRFGEDVDVWEIGSRVNSSNGMSAFLLPSTPNTSLTPDPELYAQMVKIASKIIKAADPNDQVWMGSLVSASASDCAMNPLTFMLEINGTKAWKVIDSVQYTPDRGAQSPETAATEVNAACGSSLPSNGTTLIADVQSVMDLARQLGGKTVRIEGLGWSDDNLASLASNRSISTDQLLADYLVRASVQMYGNNGITSASWNVNPDLQPSASRALANLNSVLQGAKFVNQAQGQSGSVFEYRFQKGSQWIIVAWRAQDGDAPIPVSLSGLATGNLTAYAVDAQSFDPDYGVSIPVDASGTATVMLNERPVIFIGKTAGLGESMKEDINNQMDRWKYELKLATKHGMNDLKASLLHALENLFDSAKDQVIQWGEDKLDELLN